MKKKISTLVLLLLFNLTAGLATTFTSTGSGNWSNSLTWNQGALVPGSGDNVIISAGTIVTVDASAGSNIINVTINATGTVTNNSTLSITGVLTNNGTWTNSANSSLKLSSNMTGAGTFNASANANTVTYSSSCSIIPVPSGSTYYHLTISAHVVPAGNFTVNGNFTINSGGQYTGKNGAINYRMTLAGNWTNNVSSYNVISGDVTFSGVNQTLYKLGATSPGPSNSFENLGNVFIGNTGTLTLNSNIAIDSSLTINSGSKLDVSASSYSVIVYFDWINNGGTFVPRSGSVSFAPILGANTHVGKTGSTENFYKVNLINPGTLNLTSNITCSNSFYIGTFGGGAVGTLNGSTFTITVSQDFANYSGTFNPNTSTVVMTSSSSSWLVGNPILTLYNFTRAGSGTTYLTGAFVVNNDLTISAGTLNVNSTNNTVTVGHNFTINGAFTGGLGTVILNGSTAQTLTSSGSVTFYNLTQNGSGGSTFQSGTWKISNCLTSSLGTLGQAGAASVTLPSNAASTAYIGNGAGTFSGTFKVQHWIPNPGQGNWADIGTTVSNNTVNDWDQQIYISGVGGRSGSASGFQSFTLYDETLASNNYANVGNTSTPIVPAVGYTLWLADAANPATWIAKNLACDGSPNSGSVTSPNLTYTAGSTDPGENHLANPYASHITWDASGTNITKSGNVDLSTIYVISNGNYVSHGNGFDLPAGQGFIVYSTAAGTNNITFTQACKNVATSSTFDFRETAPYNLKLKLSTAALPEFFHEISVNFDENATLGFESPYDARFIPSPEKTAPSLCMIQNGKRLTRNTFNSSAYETIQIPVKCMIGLDGTYTLEAFGAYSMTDYSCALLEDIHTHQIIDLKKTAAYSFAAKTTDNPDRFILHLSRSSQQCEQILASAKPADLFFSDNQVTVFNTPEGASVAFDLDQDTPAILSVYNVQGQKVVSDQNVVAFKNKIDLSLPSDASGMYILTVNLNGGHLVTKKIFFHH